MQILAVEWAGALTAVYLVCLVLRPRSAALHRLGILLTAALTARYLWWRLTSTLVFATWGDAVFSAALMAADLGAAAALAFFYVHLWSAHEPGPKAPPLGRAPRVDMLITIYDEPVSILYRTAVGCLEQDYPNARVYVLDDGGRDEVRELALELGCRYIARPGREGAKAGNVNYALKRTDGELVAVFDVDHIPVRSFLRETVPFFADPAVGVVQTPHHAPNDDPFRRNFTISGDGFNEQDLFYRVIMPGLARRGAAFFAGSSGVIRRRALEQVGGFRTETLTEDTHTSLQLLSKGWKIVYVPRDLVHCLVPESLKGFVIQRLRWATGNLQIVLRDCPLLKSGLSLGQRLFYTNMLSYFLFPFSKLLYLLGPVIYLYFGLRPMDATVGELGTYFLPVYLLQLVVYDAVCGRVSNFALANVYELVLMFPIMSKLLRTFVLRSSSGKHFKVTPKGELSHAPEFNWREGIPLAVVMALLLAGIYKGSWQLGARPAEWDLVAISIAWSAYNLLFCAIAVGCAQDQPYRRRSPRVRVSLPSSVVTDEGETQAKVVEMSEQGCRLDRPIQGRVKLRFPVGDVLAEGTPAGAAKFVEMTAEQRRNVIRLAYTLPESVERPSEGVAG